MSLPEFYLTLKALWDHHRSLRWSRERLETEQLRKFRRLVRFAERRSPYYQRVIAGENIDPDTCVPGDFPVLTKSDVIQHFDEIVTDRRITRERVAVFLAKSTDPADLLDGRYHVVHTSGTSGTVGYYVYSHAAWIRGSSHVVWATPLRWGRRCAFVAATRGHFAGVTLARTAGSGVKGFFYNVCLFDVCEPMPEIIRRLNEFQPHTLSGYAAIIKLLARAQERGELQIKPTDVATGGEPLTPDVKAYIERVFGVSITNIYASSEHLQMAMNLPGSDGMYLLEDELMFERHDDHTCITNLFNDAMPLIRYRMGDVLQPDGTGTNRYPFTKIHDVVGRYEDALVFTNRHGADDFIHPIVIVELIVEGLDAWQLVIVDKRSFRFRAKLHAGQTPEERRATCERIRGRMTAILTEKEMETVEFEIEEVDSLPLDPRSGKFRMVVHETPASRVTA